MRIDSEQLLQHLGRGLKTLYVVYGEELLLALEAADRIRAKARTEGISERRVLVADTHFDWGEMLMMGNNLSLFASRRLLDLRIPSGKPGKAGSEALQALAASPPDDTLVLISLPQLDRQSLASKWFESLEHAGVAVHAAKIRREHLGNWLSGRLALNGQQADARTTEFLASRVEGNLMAASQEVQKLALLFPAGPLQFDEVRNAVLDVARFDVFDIGAALLQGNRARFVRIMEGLRAEGTAPPLLLWALAEQIRALARVKSATQAGEALAEAMRNAKVWGPRQEWMPAALRRLALDNLFSALRRAAQIDRMIKGLDHGDVWDAMRELGLGLMPLPDAPVRRTNGGKIRDKV